MSNMHEPNLSFAKARNKLYETQQSKEDVSTRLLILKFSESFIQSNVIESSKPFGDEFEIRKECHRAHNMLLQSNGLAKYREPEVNKTRAISLPWVFERPDRDFERWDEKVRKDNWLTTNSKRLFYLQKISYIKKD